MYLPHPIYFCLEIIFDYICGMRIIRNNIIPFGRDFAAVNLFGILFIRHGVKPTPRLINHEKIHTRQMKELLYLFFYIIYVVEWIVRLFENHGNFFRAYMDISLEKEAYAHESDLSYLGNRPVFAQWR